MVIRLPKEREIRVSYPAFSDRVIPVTSKLVLDLLSSQAPGTIGSVPGLVSRCQFTVTAFPVRRLAL